MKQHLVTKKNFNYSYNQLILLFYFVLFYKSISSSLYKILGKHHTYYKCIYLEDTITFQICTTFTLNYACTLCLISWIFFILHKINCYIEDIAKDDKTPRRYDKWINLNIMRSFASKVILESVFKYSFPFKKSWNF